METNINWNEYIEWVEGLVSERAVKHEGEFATVSIGLHDNNFEKIHIGLENGVFLSTPVEFELTEYALSDRDLQRLCEAVGEA